MIFTNGADANKKADFQMTTPLAKDDSGQPQRFNDARDARQPTGEALLSIAQSNYIQGRKGFTLAMLEAGKLCHEYVCQRLAMGTHSRKDAIRTITGRLCEVSDSVVDVNKLIARYQVSALLGIGTDGKVLDYSTMPIGHFQEFCPLVERDCQQETWRIRAGVEAEAKALFAEVCTVKPLMDRTGLSRRVKTILADLVRRTLEKTENTAHDSSNDTPAMLHPQSTYSKGEAMTFTNGTICSKKANFLEMGTPLSVDISGQPIHANVKEFSTGSVGWNITGKVNVRLPNGVLVRCQVTGNVVVIGSKDW